ncbi:hypothetical protein, partial [Mycoplasma wenyonii]|uniref:hypothetical protein n=1 Tax=Mycoplasma wenyonii TaxID=65123 RepID=UPI0011BD11C1
MQFSSFFVTGGRDREGASSGTPEGCSDVVWVGETGSEEGVKGEGLEDTVTPALDEFPRLNWRNSQGALP